MNYRTHLFVLIAFAFLNVIAQAEDIASDVSVDFIGIQSGRAVFQITNKSKDIFDYVRYEPTKSFENSSIQIYKNEKWGNLGPFKCGTMTDEETARYVSHKLNPKDQILTSMNLDGVSLKKGDVIRIQVSLTKDNRFFEAYSNAQTIK